jgi:hypothetical protein
MNAPTGEPSSSASPAYALPDHSYIAPRVRHTSHIRLIVIFGVSLAVVIGAVFGVRALIVKPVPTPHCPQDCQGPPKGPPGGVPPGVGPGLPVPTRVPNPPPGAARGSAATTPNPRAQPAAAVGQPTGQTVKPVESFKRFPSSGDGAFSVSYPDGASVNANGVSWTDGYDRGQLFGVPADNLSPREIAQRFVKAKFPNATLAYEIPNARVGYESGYGEIDDVIPQSSSGPYDPQRVLIMVAVKNGLALVAEAAGRYFWPKNYQGHPTGASIEMVDYPEFSYWVNSFRWKDDPLR